MKPRIAKNIPEHNRREREGMSETHLANVRKCDCLGCGRTYHESVTQAHHLLRTDERGLSRKSSDRWAVPLCFWCHDPNVKDSVHHDGDEDGWFAARGIDARAVAAALWTERGNLEAMRRVIFRARQMAALKMKEAMST
jgi:hypothetical protein